MFPFVCRMIGRLKHWLQVLPPVDGADVKLMNPAQARHLCTNIDLPATTSPPSQVDVLQQSNSIDADADVCQPVAEAVSEDMASALCHSQDDSSEMLLQLPDFPLLPVSRGFQMKLQKLLAQFETTLITAGITASRSDTPS